MPLLNNEEVKQRIFSKFDGRYSLIGEYTGRRNKVLLHCNIHNIDFEVSGDTAIRMDKKGNPCPECRRLSHGKVIDLICPICGKEFKRTASSLKGKNNVYFCSKQCKDLAAKIDSGINIQPDFFKGSNYRIRAFNFYPHHCAVCGWGEDERILEVHHKDSNRENNSIENLCILCPICHRKITLKYYQLTDDNKLTNMPD